MQQIPTLIFDILEHNWCQMHSEASTLKLIEKTNA